jgi:DNA-binding transcriptional MerR regulator
MDQTARIERFQPAPQAGTSSPAKRDRPGEVFSIRDLGREFGVTARTLRFYEEKGLLSPQREGQDRLYGRRDRARLKYVLMGKCVGFSLDEIREMLDLYDLGDRQETQLKAALGKFQDRIGRLEKQKAEIDRALAELVHARKLIEGMLATRERNGDRR